MRRSAAMRRASPEPSSVGRLTDKTIGMPVLRTVNK